MRSTLTWTRARRISLRAQGMGRIRRDDPPTPGERPPRARTPGRTPLLDPASDGSASIEELVARAARSLGIFEIGSLADHFRLRVREVAPAVEALIAQGELQEVEVSHPAGARRMLLHRDAQAPAPLRVTALVSPFDPVVDPHPRLAHLVEVE